MPKSLDPKCKILALRTLLACTLLSAQLGAPAFALTPEHPGGAITAFIDVNVVPMDAEHVLRNQTVLIENGKIAAIGPRLKVPESARVLDGHGAYLSPGLTDMHTHSDTREDLKVYLANGVTSVLNMGDASAGFIDTLRPEANDGRIPGPHVYAGFMIDGSPRYNNLFVTTPAEARAIVHIAKTNGYDFIKVYNDLPADCFQALIDEGKRLHMPVVGHGVTAVGLRRQLDAGQVMVAHIVGTDAPNVPGLFPGFSVHDDLDALQAAGLSRYRVLAAATRTAGEFIHRSLPNTEPFGTVTAGSRADLIMTAGNPLADLSTLRKPRGVMANGKWYSANDLQGLLESVAAEYNSALTHQR